MAQLQSDYLRNSARGNYYVAAYDSAKFLSGINSWLPNLVIEPVVATVGIGASRRYAGRGF